MKTLPWVEGNRKLRDTGSIGWGIPADEVPSYAVRFHILGLPLTEGQIGLALAKFDRVSRKLKTFKTCPGAGDCRLICYAKKGSYRYPCVIHKRLLALAWTFTDGWVGKAIDDLSKTKMKAVRIHDSGDFYSQEYLRNWFEIADCHPEKLFYAYSKSLHLDWTEKPKNFILAQSVGGKYDSLMKERLPIAYVVAKGWIGCSENSDKEILAGETRVYMEKH